MLNNSVKTSTPLPRFVQILCLTVFWLLLTLLAGTARAATPTQQLHEQVRQWLSKTHGVEPAGVEIAALDPRLQVQACDRSLQVDHPFASRDTVRVRCAQPVWQLYLQVNLSAPTPVASKSAAPRMMVVPKRLVPRGTVLEPEMLEEVVISGANSGLNTDPSLLSSVQDVTYAEVVRDLMAGAPIRASDLRRATMVKQGQLVNMVIGEKTSFQVIVRAEALQDGRMGEQVKLKNTESGRQISGVVTGPNQVKGL